MSLFTFLESAVCFTFIVPLNQPHHVSGAQQCMQLMDTVQWSGSLSGHYDSVESSTRNILTQKFGACVSVTLPLELEWGGVTCGWERSLIGQVLYEAFMLLVSLQPLGGTQRC